jgi:hypothetical protein
MAMRTHRIYLMCLAVWLAIIAVSLVMFLREMSRYDREDYFFVFGVGFGDWSYHPTSTWGIAGIFIVTALVPPLIATTLVLVARYLLAWSHRANEI